MYRLSRNGLYIDQNVYRENHRSEYKIKFKCPFTKIVMSGKALFIGGGGVDPWNSLKVEHLRAETKKYSKSC